PTGRAGVSWAARRLTGRPTWRWTAACRGATTTGSAESSTSWLREATSSQRNHEGGEEGHCGLSYRPCAGVLLALEWTPGPTARPVWVSVTGYRIIRLRKYTLRRGRWVRGGVTGKVRFISGRTAAGADR